MSRRLIVRPFAEQAIALAFEHYHAIRPELGRRFMAAVDRAIASIEERPETWPQVTPTKRKYPLYLEDSFPYVLYYSVSDTEIVILTVIHGKRDSSRWKRAR